MGEPAGGVKRGVGLAVNCKGYVMWNRDGENMLRIHERGGGGEGEKGRRV